MTVDMRAIVARVHVAVLHPHRRSASLFPTTTSCARGRMETRIEPNTNRGLRLRVHLALRLLLLPLERLG